MANLDPGGPGRPLILGESLAPQAPAPPDMTPEAPVTLTSAQTSPIPMLNTMHLAKSAAAPPEPDPAPNDARLKPAIRRPWRSPHTNAPPLAPRDLDTEHQALLRGGLRKREPWAAPTR